MKKYSFILAAIAVSLASCNKDQNQFPDGTESQDEVRYELSVSFPDVEVATRVATSSTDNTVGNVQVVVFNASGVLETSANLTSTSGTLNVSAGSKTVYAVANVPVATHSFLTAADADAIISTATALSDNVIGGGFVMIGHGEVTVNGASSLSISLSRIAAKFELGSIKVNFNPALAGSTLTINRVYVQNAVVNSTLAGAKSLVNADFANQMKFVSGSYDQYLSQAFTSSNTIADNSTSTSFASKYYAYPNQTTNDVRTSPFSVRKTRLVIAATLNGETTYYPVTFGPIEGNKYYRVNAITITGYGVDNPEDDPSKESLTVSVTVTDWELGQQIEPTI